MIFTTGIRWTRFLTLAGALPFVAIVLFANTLTVITNREFSFNDTPAALVSPSQQGKLRFQFDGNITAKNRDMLGFDGHFSDFTYTLNRALNAVASAEIHLHVKDEQPLSVALFGAETALADSKPITEINSSGEQISSKTTTVPTMLSGIYSKRDLETNDSDSGMNTATSSKAIGTMVNAYITNLANNTVSVINPATGSILATITNENFNEPYGISVTPDGSEVWVTNAAQESGGASVTVISTSTNQVLRAISLSGHPQAIAFYGGNAYIPLEGACSDTCPIAIVNTSSYSVRTSTGLSTIGQPTGIAIAGSTAYITNEGTDSNGNNLVSVFDLEHSVHLGDISVQKGPTGITVSPNGSTVWVVNQNSNSLSYFTVGIVSGSASSFSIGSGSGPECIAISPNGKTGYVTRAFPSGNVVQVIDLIKHADVAGVTVGSYPFGINLTADGLTAVVSTDQGAWTIDTTTNTAVGGGIGESEGPSFGNFIQTQSVNILQGDFNDDGKADFVLLGSCYAVVALSQGNGIFNSNIYYYPSGWIYGAPPSSRWAPVVGDFNGDGKSDFAMLGSSTADIFLSESETSGTFAAYGYSYPTGWTFRTPPTSNYTPVVGDFNGDGKTDFVMLGNNAANTFLSNGDGTFAAYGYSYPTGWTFGTPPTSDYTPVVGDFNGDGKTDFAMLGNNAANLFLSAGSGSFTASGYSYPGTWTFGAPPTLYWLAVVGDFDGVNGTDFLFLGEGDCFKFLSNGSGGFIGSAN